MQAQKHPPRRFRRFLLKKETLLVVFSGVLLLLGLFALWAANLRLPDVSSFNDRVVSQSTKFYDRTGQILLFNTYENVRRTSVPLTDISKNLRNATVAIEDVEFYQHHGIKPTSILRAMFANATSLEFSQGGSTITQQVVKNSLLTSEKSVTRKLKEWVLALKLERVMSKDQILEIYLNEAPYGGNIYGAEEASQTFFGVSSRSLTLAQAAYLAALPQAPSYYSPYGNHLDGLLKRKDLVLQKMLENKFITEGEYNEAKKEAVVFRPQVRSSLLAPHFVFFVKDYLEQKYGVRALDEQGLRVTTTIDATLQQKAEEILKRQALANKEKFDAENASLVAIDPKTGQILSMVGSRDYFDKEIGGNFNVALAKRQPGSSFKPFVYATAFKKGYTPETVVFDAKTQFGTECPPEDLSKEKPCFSPDNYDNKFRGPVSFRSAIAQSLNVPSVKVLYLAGISDSIQTARDVGITTLSNANQYGLTLVLGGGEVSLLEMVSSYGVFANDGVRNPYTGILKIENSDGNTLEEFTPKDSAVLSSDVARTISDVLSDNSARSPTFGEQSALYFPGRQVAVKTGTTNDYRDAWIIGYTPSLVVGSWAGNNDNRPMQKKVAGLIVAPMWNEFMSYALQTVPNERFKQVAPTDESKLPPALRGIWWGGDTGEIHSILYWLNKNNILGGKPANPESDPQFLRWEYGIKKWINENGVPPINPLLVTTPGSLSATVNNSEGKISINGLSEGIVYPFSSAISFSVLGVGIFDLARTEVFLNNSLISTLNRPPFYFSFSPKDYFRSLKENSVIKVIGYDIDGNKKEASINFSLDFNH
ncbi:MAG: PBP1A family penicillin-binding protein [bacterium]|nr:PBP1A family penicillin-binding protein [bacterium]